MVRSITTYNAYQRVYQLNRYHTRRAEAIEFLGGKCAFCESTVDLEIDHIEKHEKDISLSKLWSISKIRFYQELQKCQVLCKLCHKGKSKLDNTVGHGGGLTGVKNCYCKLCAPLKRLYSLEWKRKFNTGR